MSYCLSSDSEYNSKALTIHLFIHRLVNKLYHKLPSIYLYKGIVMIGS